MLQINVRNMTVAPVSGKFTCPQRFVDQILNFLLQRWVGNQRYQSLDCEVRPAKRDRTICELGDVKKNGLPQPRLGCAEELWGCAHHELESLLACSEQHDILVPSGVKQGELLPKHVVRLSEVLAHGLDVLNLCLIGRADIQ